jgi:hypothetical protein
MDKQIQIVFGVKKFRKRLEPAIMVYNTEYIKEVQDNIIKDLRTQGHMESIYFES